ncbi:hypothetical protein ABT093_18170 [Kitasatospora sp. NPDC002551]|uniref:hypothetical protein n=1 Tax=unclassified Kitasatospora TaxID=2633591 RepID=UPI003320C125
MTDPGPAPRRRVPGPPGSPGSPVPPGAGPDERARRTDYAGAVYGSMLAASVIAASSVDGPHPRFSLILLLVVTGLVFWAAHVYAHVAGQREAGRQVSRRQVVEVGRHEWPIVEAAALPALAVLVSPWLGTRENAWLALGVAVAQQVGWASLGARRAGAAPRQVLAEAVVNLLLGLVIVAAKVAVGH